MKPQVADTLIHLAQQDQKKIAKKIATVSAQINDGIAHLEHLKAYRAEYEGNVFHKSQRIEPSKGMKPAQTRLTLEASQIIRRTAFLEKIDDAMKHQQLNIDFLNESLQALQIQVMEHRKREKKFEVLKKRDEIAKKVAQIRGEQKESDEIATRKFLY